MGFKSATSYIKFGLWHYYYRSHYLIFLTSLLISSIISYGAYIYSISLFAILILVLWFEEKIILLYVIYFIWHDEMRRWIMPYLDANLYIDARIPFFDSFTKNINDKLITTVNEVFDKMNTSLMDNFYTYAPILVLAVIANRIIINVIAKVFKIYL